MSGSLDQTLRELNDCGCCEGTSRETPVSHRNRPGLSAIAYRTGEWASFRETLLAYLSSPDLPALGALKTRDNHDYTIALLDAFAMVGDVLTFYQERNANEAYLRTATERLSVLELARLIGYRLSPGVAASAYLAFSAEDVSGGTQIRALSAQTGSTAQITAPPSWPRIPAGVKVQSVPGPDERAQTFETIEEIEARPDWNRLRPRLSELRYPRQGETTAWLAGAPVLEPGDRLLFVGQERLDSVTSLLWNVRRVVNIQSDAQRGRTRVVWDKPLSAPPAESRLYVFRQRASIFGYNAPDWMSLPKDTKLSYLGLSEGSSVPSEYAAEWPKFEIFSPKFPEVAGPPLSGSIKVNATVADVVAAAAAAAGGASHSATGAAAGAGMSAVNSAARIASDSIQQSRIAAENVRTLAFRVGDDVMRAARLPLNAGVAAFDALIRPASEVITHRTLNELKVLVETITLPDSSLDELASASAQALERVREEIGLLKSSIEDLSVSTEIPGLGALAEIDQDLARLQADFPNIIANPTESNPLADKYPTLFSHLEFPYSPLNLMEASMAWLSERIQKEIDSLQHSTSGTSPYVQAMEKLAEIPGELNSVIAGMDGVVTNPLGTLADVLQSVRAMAAEAASASHTIAAEVSRAALETGSSTLKQMDSMVRHAALQASRNASDTVNALNPLPAFETLTANAANLASAVDETQRMVTQAVAANVAAAAVDLAVKAELQNPERTPESVATAAKEAARIAVDAAPYVVIGGATAAGGAALAGGAISAFGLPAAIAAAAVGGAEAMSGFTGGDGPVSAHAAAAREGAALVQSQVGIAVNQALMPDFQIYIGSRKFPELTADTVDLDQSYPKITEGSWIVLSLPNGPELYRAMEVAESSRAAFLLSGKTTRIKLSGDLEALKTRFGDEVRRTAVFAQSEELPLAETPLFRPVWRDQVTLDSAVEGLTEGRTVIVIGHRARRVLVGSTAAPLTLIPEDGTSPRLIHSGSELYAAADPEPVPGVFNKLRWRLMDQDGLFGVVDALTGLITYLTTAASAEESVSEVATVHAVGAIDGTYSQMKLANSLVNVYRRDTVTIAANVARATHGESVAELLGSGDASSLFPAFELKQKPLTYVASSAPSGGESTLEVRVNDIRWEEVSSLYLRLPEERIYVTELGENGTTTVRFGNGVQGAAVPTGRNNVRAVYRKGIGSEGMVAAGQMSQLMTRPLGVTDVVNPLPAEGAQDPEPIEEARHNAPLKILTLDRLVSLQDYEDFARAFAGVGKALATWTWSGERNGIYLTLAGSAGSVLSSHGETVTNLIAALREYGDPGVLLETGPFRPVRFRLRASVRVSDDYDESIVLRAVEVELRLAFSFNTREFGQTVALSEIAAVIHRVKGVAAVNVTELYRQDGPPELNPLLFAFLPRAGTDVSEAAELLMLHEDPVALETMV